METRLRATPEQFACLLEFMERHGDLSKAQPGVQGRVRSDRLWQQLAGQLNSVKNGGVVKSVDKWKKVWADWKTKTKKKYLNYQHARAAGRPTPGRQQMTGLEDRVVAILSASANQGIQDLGIVYSNNDDSNNVVPQYGMGEVEVHISNIKDSPANSPVPSPHMEDTIQSQSPIHVIESPPEPEETPSQSNRRQAATVRRLIQRARRNREQTLNRMLTQFVTIENRRLQLEEEKEQRLHEREMERLRIDSRRIEAAREQNRLLEQIAVMGQQIIEIIAHQGRN